MNTTQNFENNRIEEVASSNQNKESKNVPEIKFKAGPITATVWHNSGLNKEGDLTSYNTIAIERVYKDKQNNWQKTSSMRVNDLPKATLVLKKAYEYLVLNSQNQMEASA